MYDADNNYNDEANTVNKVMKLEGTNPIAWNIPVNAVLFAKKTNRSI